MHSHLSPDDPRLPRPASPFLQGDIEHWERVSVRLTGAPLRQAVVDEREAGALELAFAESLRDLAERLVGCGFAAEALQADDEGRRLRQKTEGSLAILRAAQEAQLAEPLQEGQIKCDRCGASVLARKDGSPRAHRRSPLRPERCE